MQDEDPILKSMKALGWDTTAEIPMANEENQALMRELAELTEERAKLKENYIKDNDRLTKILHHKKNTENNVICNMKLIQAYQEEVRTETHLYKIHVRESAKLKQDIKNLDKELEYTMKYGNQTEQELSRIRSNISQKTNSIKWAKIAMLEWEEAMSEGHKGYLLIDKYFKEDEKKAREMDYIRQKLGKDIDKDRAKLVNIHNERKCLEQNLDSISNLYRIAHGERREIIETWKIAVKQMIQRENDIVNAESEMAALKVESQKKEDERKLYDNKLNAIIENNHEIEATIEAINAETSDMKDRMQKLADMVALKENEIELVQKELQALANHVQQQRAQNARTLKQKGSKLIELQAFDKVLAKLEKRLNTVKNKSLNAQQRLEMLEELMVTEQRAQKDLNKQLFRLNGTLYRAQEHVTKYKSEEKVLTIANSGLQVTIAAIKNNIEKTEKHLTRLTEDYYNQAYKCMQMERQVRNLQGAAVDAETEYKNLQYLYQLEEQNTVVTRRLQAIESQNKKLDDNMKKLTISYNNDSKEMTKVEFSIKEAEVYCDGGIKRLKDQSRKNQILMVELSLLRLRVKEVEDEVNRYDEETYDLERLRSHLKRSYKDRLVEIKSQINILQFKRKQLNEEKSTLKADIAERTVRLNAVKSRFELSSKLMGRNDDGSLVTAAQMKIEMAQERQELLNEGNILNERVIKAEQEVKALENTLHLFNISNESYRNQYEGQNQEDQSLARRKHLQSDYCKVLDKLKTVRRKILKMEKDNERALVKKEELESILESTHLKKMQSNEILSKLQKDVEDQNMKLERAERDLKQTIKQFKKQKRMTSELLNLFEKEQDLREIEDKNMRAVSALSDFAENDMEIGPYIIRILDQVGIQTLRQLRKTHSIASFYSARSEASFGSSRDPLPAKSSNISVGSEASQVGSTRLSVVSIEFQEKGNTIL